MWFVDLGIFIANIENEDTIDTLARVTRVLISTVGPFLKYGTPVLEACALNGTHYVDSTIETPWVREMIKKYHKTAQVNGAIVRTHHRSQGSSSPLKEPTNFLQIIPQCGVQSAPADLAAYSLVKLIRERLNCPTDNVVLALCDMKSGMSGGTIETFLSVWENATLQEMFHARRTYALSPVKGYDVPFSSPIYNNNDLGLLTKNIQASHDEKIVMRSWGLAEGGEYYGQHFMFKEYTVARNMLMAIFVYFMMSAMQLLPYLVPVR